MAYVIGVDIGTYESKGVLVDQDGNILVNDATPHKLEVPQPGWAEHDAEKTWWKDFKTLSRRILAKAKDEYGILPKDVQAVGVSSIAPAAVPIDRQGKPLRKAILYGVDTRAKEEINLLNKTIGKKVVFDTGAQYLSSQSMGPKLLWIKRNEKNIYNQTYKFLCGSGYLVFKLTDEYIIDHYTAASYSPLFNIHQLTWDESIVQKTIDLDLLPRLAWSHEVVGEVTKKAASETGLKEGTKVIAGTADALSESISIGAVHPGDLMMMYGSSTFFINITDSILNTEKFWPNIHAVDGIYTLTGGTATAGSLTRWYLDNLVLPHLDQAHREQMSTSDLYTHITNQAEKSPVGAKGLITLPYYSGERSPVHDPNAKGMMFGFTLQHSNNDIFRSIIEGISFSIRHNIDEMKQLKTPITRAIVVGGGVNSTLWMQSVSDICRINQIVPKTTVGAAYGDAFLCALALGWYTELKDIGHWVQYETEIKPKQENFTILEENYQLYRQLYEQTKSLMNQT